jgi:hypothetical protein
MSYNKDRGQKVPMIIGMYGLPRSGKDTAADLMVNEFGFAKESFAKPLYEEVAAAFNVTIENLQSSAWKTYEAPELSLYNCNDHDFVDAIRAIELFYGMNSSEHEQAFDKFEYSPRTSRFILQRWATEYRRADDPLYWVWKMRERLVPLLEAGRDVVIADLREEPEVQLLLGHATALGLPIRILEVTREGTVSNGHSSDNALPRHYIHTTIRNDHLDEYLSTIRRTINNVRRTK